MGIIDFFSKKNGGLRKQGIRHQLSSSEDESDSSFETKELHNIRQKLTKKVKKDTKQRYTKSKARPHLEDSESDEALTKEELFELPAKLLRRKCRRLGLDSSKAVEKKELVSLIHKYYKSSQAATKDGDIKIITSPNVHTTSTTNLPTSFNDHDLVSTIQEIIPYFGQGDPNIDQIVIDTIQQMSQAALEERDQNGNTLLLLACQCNAQDLVPILLTKGSDPNAKNTFGETSLHFSVYTDSYSPASANVLVSYGANAEMPEDRFGCTALHYAASTGDAELCRTLLEGGALPTTLDFNGCDSILYATQSNMSKCIQLLRNASQWAQGESKIDTNYDRGYNSDWEQLVDHQTGMSYYHCRTTGKSLWADEYNFYRDNKTHQSRNTSLANVEQQRQSSFRKPPPSDEDMISATMSVVVADTKDAYLTPLKPDAKDVYSEAKDHMQYERRVSRRPSRRDTITRNKRQTGIIRQEITLDPRNDLKSMLSDSASSSELSSKSDNHFEIMANAAKEEMDEFDIKDRKQVPEEVTLSQTVNSKKLVSQESFNQRLDSMQDKFLEALKEQKVETSNVVEFGDIIPLNRSHTAIQDTYQMDLEIEQLKATLTGKNQEINNLTLHIETLKIDPSSVPDVPKVNVSDAMVGDADVSDEMWIAARDYDIIKEEHLRKSNTINELHGQCIELKASSNINENKIVSMEEMQIFSSEQVLLMEDLLNQEKDAKNEAIVLLEQVRTGIAGEEDVARSLRDEMQRGEDIIARLRSDLKKEKANLDTSEKKILQQSTELLSSKKELESCQSSWEVTKQSLQQTEELAKQQKTVNGQLNDQLYKEEKAKRHAELAAAEATQHARNTDHRLDQMKATIKEAKVMLASNEKLHKSLHLEIEKRKTLHNKLEDLKGKIRVYARIRPLSVGETEKKCIEALVKEDKRTCVMHRPDAAPKSWEFDQVFGGGINSQEDVFKDTKALITSTIDGFNVCVCCYGQTGSGKTFTMLGPTGEIPLVDHVHEIDDDTGLAPRAIVELFSVLGDRSTSFDVSVSANMFELYNDSIRDLIACSKGEKNKSLRIKLAEHSTSGLVEVDEAATVEVNDAIGLLDIFRRGTRSRSTASTKMNADSSRSHLIMSVVTKLVNKRTGKCTSGKLTLVDLAGSERVSKSGATGIHLKETQSINKSLSALGDVINSLTSGSKHIPYRNHPLTMLMSDSIGGNAKTLMLVCCSPADYNTSESTNSLDFAKRCKHVKNNIKDGSIEDKPQIKALKTQLARMKKERGGGLPVTRQARRPGTRI